MTQISTQRAISSRQISPTTCLRTTATSTAWTLAINTAPDPRFVLGATPAGVLGSNYRLL